MNQKTINKVRKIRVITMSKKEINLEECIYHEIVNRPGLLKKLEKNELVNEKGGLSECYICDGVNTECSDYKSIKEVSNYKVE